MINFNLKTGILLLVLQLTVQIANSQDFVYDWVRSAGGEHWDLANDIVIDSDKNVYMTGGFEQTAFFGSDSLVSAGSRDMFIAKYDSLGTLQWVKRAGGKKYDNPIKLIIDKEQNLLLTGNFQDTCYFEGQQLISESFTNTFIAKYSKTGNLIQTISFNADPRESRLILSLADNTDFFLSGSFYKTMNINIDTLRAEGDKGVFIARFTNDMQFKSLSGINAYGKIALKDIKYFNRQFFILCDFTDSIDINSNRYWSFGSTDMLMLKTDTFGNISNVKQFAGFGTDKAVSLIFGSDSSIYASGEFESKLYFDNDSLISKGGKDIILIKTDPDLNTLWQKQIGSKTNEYTTGLLINTVNALYLSGSFSDSLSVENKTIISDNFTEDMFLTKYTPEGENIGLKQAGGSGNEYNNVIINDPNNYLYIIGNFAYDFAFETDSISSDSVFNANNDDVFIARFYDCDYARYPEIGNDTSFCGYGSLQVLNNVNNSGEIFGHYKKYIWNTGHRGRFLTVYDSGYYSVTTYDNHKCRVTSDSIFAAVYPVPEPNLGDDINAESGNIIELFGGYFTSYLWSNDSTSEHIFINPDTLSMPINIVSLTVENDYNCIGEDDINIFVEGPSFSPPPGGTQNSQNENYNENITNNDSNNSINSGNGENFINTLAGKNKKDIVSASSIVYPNPNNGHFFINLNNINEKIISMRIYSEEGRKVYEQKKCTSDNNIEINIRSKGAHYLVLETLNHLFIEKIIIQ